MRWGLGTAQFGMDYGITNTHGKVEQKSIKEILSIAHENGIDYLDTASVYGESEKSLGANLKDHLAFNITTKIPAFKKESITSKDADQLKKIFNQSLKNLQVKSVHGLLLHEAKDLLAENGNLLFEAMEEFKRRGQVKKIGISIYNAEEIDQVIDLYPLDLIQIPISVLDQRLVHSGHLKKLEKKGIEIHARSIFLQGILLATPDKLNNYFDPLTKQITQYHHFLKENKLTPIQGAMSFIKEQREIDVAFFGVSSPGELKQILSDLKSIPDGSFDFKPFQCTQESMVNPSLWKIKK